MKIKFKNISAAALQDKKPGDVFRLEADANNIPVDAYWRRRLDEKAITLAVVAAPVPEPVAVPAPEDVPAPAATVARAARTAAAKQKD